MASLFNFYTSASPEYFVHEGKPHYNMGNSFIHSDLYKKINPVRQRYEAKPGEYSQAPFYFGHVPQMTWVYGNLDYSFNKYHRHYQAHDDWLPDRKNKTLGNKSGGFASPNMLHSKYLVLQPQKIPRGCFREIRRYQSCAAEKNKEACLNEKISIMEVCPDHVLEALREKRKWYLRAQAIDNQTYKRAMKVSEYNRGRSVSDLEIKDWSYGMPQNLRTESTWQDDRYDPTKYPHPHRYDNVNFPEQEYKDFFGGTIGTAENQEMEKHRLGLFSGVSAAMLEQQSKKKRDSSEAPKEE
jgi:hypothetical protein